MSNADKIRRMLAEGKTAKEISKKLGVPNSYVHTIKWQDKKTSKIIGAVFDATRDVRKAKEKKPKTPRRAVLKLAKIKRDPKAEEWVKQNRWFGEDEEKTAKALKLHDLLVKDGVDPKSDEYWRRVDIDLKQDNVNKPPHYTTGGIDFLDYAEAKGLTENAYLFNVVKYVSRAGKKVGSDPIEDLKKAQFYLNREIAIRERA